MYQEPYIAIVFTFISQKSRLYSIFGGLNSKFTELPMFVKFNFW